MAAHNIPGLKSASFNIYHLFASREIKCSRHNISDIFLEFFVNETFVSVNFKYCFPAVQSYLITLPFLNYTPLLTSFLYFATPPHSFHILSCPPHSFHVLSYPSLLLSCTLLPPHSFHILYCPSILLSCTLLPLLTPFVYFAAPYFTPFILRSFISQLKILCRT